MTQCKLRHFCTQEFWGLPLSRIPQPIMLVFPTQLVLGDKVCTLRFIPPGDLLPPRFPNRLNNILR